MGSQWPPSPHVEDEESALKHEISHKAEIDGKLDVDGARCRGTVDQHPIILDVHHAAGSGRDYNSSADNEGDSIRTQSSDDSCGPPTPTFSKFGRQHGPSLSVRSPSHSRSEKGLTPRRSREVLKGPPTLRGRPSIPRIHTNLGTDVPENITGQRRAPSPYSFTKPETGLRPENAKGFSETTFLSPENLAPSHPFPTAYQTKRHSSARPRSKSRSRTDLDESSDVERRRHRHSRHRSARPASPKGRPSIDGSPRESHLDDRKSSFYAYPPVGQRYASSKDVDSEITQRTHANHAQKQRSPKERPPGSPAADSWSRDRSDRVSNSEERLSKDSPYTSSAEEDRPSRHGTLSTDDERRPRQPTVVKKERPRLDLSGHQNSFRGGPTEALAGSDSSSRPSKTPSVVSSRSSPSCTPPCTPRGDRRSTDYFGQGSSAPLPPSDSVRYAPPPHSEGPYGPVKAPTGAAAAALGPRAMPPPIRGSTLSADIHGNGDPMWPGNSRKSRNTSPVSAGREPLPRAGREHERGQSKINRDEGTSNSRQGLRTGPLPYNPPQSATSDCSNLRSVSYASAPLSRPRLNHRAHSHSAADAPHPRQPSSARLTQLQFGHAAVPHLSPLTNAPGLPRSPASLERVPRQMPSAELPPCPRAVAVSGYYDWSTIVGMPQLDICPSCMTVLAASPFRDMFVVSTSTVPGQRILCDFSRAWLRHAWAQIIKQRRSSLEMIYQIVRNSETTKSCPGKGSDIRAWYRLPDPEKGTNIPNFDACSECVRSIEIIFPQLRGIFKRSGALVQERTCDLTTQSSRFDGYLKLLDAAALQYDVERLKEPNIQPFANHARKTARVRECTRDDMVLDQVWHFIPALPQFTICEECFDQVVWPVADQPVARSVNRTLQLVPGGQRSAGLSCQLYSERMRKRFLEAVQHADFEYLKQVALRRHNMERALQEKHKALINDMAAGIGRTTELQANIEEWRRWE